MGGGSVPRPSGDVSTSASHPLFTPPLSGENNAQHDRGGGGIPLVCRLRLVCHPETAGLCGGFSLCKVTFISRISHYVKERIVVIMFRRRRIVAACSPVVSVCTRWRRIVAVPAMCV